LVAQKQPNFFMPASGAPWSTTFPERSITFAGTYYEDPRKLVDKADYVMANPPFNVNEIDADKIESDPRLPFGLSGVNKKGKVSNSNYVWISYFYSYLSKRGRAGLSCRPRLPQPLTPGPGGRQKLVERRRGNRRRSAVLYYGIAPYSPGSSQRLWL
jgi:hypothetical protein